ncbi:MAG: (2Fe-2S) ferredoxin domain-containing protein [Clostridia bacterium]
MVKLEVCMGTACHLRGSRQVIEELQSLITKNNLKDKIDFCGKFCLGQCDNKGVSISLNGKEYDVMPNEVLNFFNETVMAQVK